MPQASDDLRDLMGLMFDGERIADGPPTEFLQSRGYKPRPDWTWDLPSPDHYVTEKEELCLRFLCDEWDWGWINTPPIPALQDC